MNELALLAKDQRLDGRSAEIGAGAVPLRRERHGREGSDLVEMLPELAAARMLNRRCSTIASKP